MATAVAEARQGKCFRIAQMVSRKEREKDGIYQEIYIGKKPTNCVLPPETLRRFAQLAAREREQTWAAQKRPLNHPPFSDAWL